MLRCLQRSMISITWGKMGGGISILSDFLKLQKKNNGRNLSDLTENRRTSTIILKNPNNNLENPGPLPDQLKNGPPKNNGGKGDVKLTVPLINLKQSVDKQQKDDQGNPVGFLNQFRIMEKGIRDYFELGQVQNKNGGIIINPEVPPVKSKQPKNVIPFSKNINE
jgi:hypothetical protein